MDNWSKLSFNPAEDTLNSLSDLGIHANTSARGSTPVGGRTSTERSLVAQNQSGNDLATQASPKSSPPASDGSVTTGAVYSDQDMDRLVVALGYVQTAQNLFGQKAIDIPAKAQAIVLFLRQFNFPMDRICAAIEAIVPYQDTMPTPNQIRKWIEENKPATQLALPDVELQDWHRKCAQEMGEAIARSWLYPCRYDVDNGVIIAPTRFITEWIEQHYVTKISNIIGVQVGVKHGY